LAIGIVGVVASLLLSSTRVGKGLVFGFAAFVVFFAVLALFARRRAPDHWGLLVIGLVMFIVPWLGSGYTADRGAAWTAWIVGAAAMILGGIGWVRDKPPSEFGISQYNAGDTRPGTLARWIGRAALIVGLGTVALGVAVHTSAAGIAVMIGLGGLISVFAVWSMLAADPTRDYLALAIFGFTLVVAPWIGGFTGDRAGWTAWVTGILTTVLGVVGYLRGERIDFGTTVRENADQRYRERYR
jgi:hypothetical protein